MILRGFKSFLSNLHFPAFDLAEISNGNNQWVPILGAEAPTSQEVTNVRKILDKLHFTALCDGTKRVKTVCLLADINVREERLH